MLLFALEGSQTWSGYKILFEHWRLAHIAHRMRERLKVVAALVPEVDRVDYLQGIREHSYEIFVDSLYDEIAPPPSGSIGPARDNLQSRQVNQIVEGWNFDEADEGAPHYPWPIHWQRSFAGLRSLQGRLAVIDAQEVKSIFGPLIDGITGLFDSENVNV